MRNEIIAVLAIAMLLIGFGLASELKPAQTETSTFTTTTTIGGVVSTQTLTITTTTTISGVPLTETSTYTTTTTLGGVELLGKCTTVGWEQADTSFLTNTTITEASGGSTTYVVSQVGTTPSPFPINTTSYTTTSYGDVTGGFTVVSTSYIRANTIGALVWAVTSCDFGPLTGP